MANINEIYKINLSELFYIAGSDRILPNVVSGVQQWWRYLGDDYDGGWCLYTAQYSHLTGMPTEDDHYYDLITGTDIEPCFYDDGSCAKIINITDKGDYELQSVDYTGQGSFILTPEELEACGTLVS